MSTTRDFRVSSSGSIALLRESDAPVRLSLDMRIQYVLAHEVDETSALFQTNAAGGIVLDVRTGEILAIVVAADR